MKKKTNKYSATRIAHMTCFVIILLCSATSMVFSQTKTEIDQQYFFSKKPFIHPNIIKDLETWISDEREQVVAINVPGSMGTNRYFGDITVEQSDAKKINPVVAYTDSAYCEEHTCVSGPPFFSYELVGKTSSGIYVLFTKDSGGGSGLFENLLLVSLQTDKALSYDKKNHTLKMNRKRLVIKRLKEFRLGDQYFGTITLNGNVLHIGKNKSGIKTELFKKDADIKIEGSQ